MACKTLPVKVVRSSGSDGQEERKRGQIKQLEDHDRSQKHQKININNAKKSIINQLKQSTKSTPKSYTQIALTNATKILLEKS